MSTRESEQHASKSLRNLDPEKLRSDFPLITRPQPGKRAGVTHPLIYFDNAATTQKPRQVISALTHYYEHENANVHRALYRLGEQATQAYESSRRDIATFINAEHVHEIIFTRGTTEAINLVAAAWGRKHLQEGDEIILTEMEHHSNLIPWQMLGREKKLHLRFIPFLNDGTLDYDKVNGMFNERTRLVAISHMSNVFGTINSVRGIIRKAHARNIPVLLDGAQSVPHIPVDVQYLDCDFLAFSGHKMCGPTGIGVLYGKEALLEEMDPYQGGGDMISSVWLDRATWNELPYKFEAGTPNIAGAVGLAAAVRYLSKIGMAKITRYEQALTTYAILEMNRVQGIRFYGTAPERGGVISFNLGEIHPHDMAQFLDSQHIAVRAGHHCAQPIMRKLGIPATTRASLYFYNTFAEVDKFVNALYQAKEFFG